MSSLREEGVGVKNANPLQGSIVCVLYAPGCSLVERVPVLSLRLLSSALVPNAPKGY